MTLLVASIAIEKIGELETRANRAWAGGADAVEVRIDTFADDPARLAAYLKAHRDHTWIVTCRSVDEGGGFRGDAADRASLALAAAGGTDAHIVFELADWRRSGDLRRRVSRGSARTTGSGHRLILSAHDFKGLPANLAVLVDEITREPEVAVAKVAYRANHICDGFSALDLMHERGGGVAAIAMGGDGLWTRVLAGKLGAFATYCALDSESATAPGQVTLDEMVHRYRWPAVDSSTKVFGVIGDPVAHSMSPLLFNHWFADAGVSAVYLPLRVGREGDHLRRFLDGCRERRWLDVGGFSVTIPHKTSSLQWVGDGADHMSSWLGALNTLVFREEAIRGYNTDCHAAVSSMMAALGCSRGDCLHMPVDVLGTGGAARAVVHGLCVIGCDTTVYGRSPDKTQRVASGYGARAAAWEDRVARGGEVLVNCTNVGMWPDVDRSPMPADALPGCRLAFDLIYNPLQTRLLKDASELGCSALNGLDMFIRQAAVQFELWTGKPPDTRDARDLIIREIQKQSELHA